MSNQPDSLTGNTPEYTELKDDITSIIYSANWKNSDIAKAFKPDVEAVMNLITLHTKEAIDATNSKGHWYTKEKQLDAYWNFCYWCNCGYKSSSRDALDSHVLWKIEELKAQLTNPTERKA